MDKNKEDFILLKDREWQTIAGQVCLITDFTPFALVDDDKVKSPDLATPYAVITLRCDKFSHLVKGAITQRIDFLHLWKAFKERGIKKDEEVLIVWQLPKSNFLFRLFSFGLPKLRVMIWRKGSYKTLYNTPVDLHDVMFEDAIETWKWEIKK